MTDNLENIYELTPLQQGLLIETLSKPDSDAYTIQFILTLDATQLDLNAWQYAWQKVLDRHAILRSAFYWQDLDKPVQVVLQEVALPWVVLDWRGQADTSRQWSTWQQADLQQAFALDNAPLFRCALIQIDDNTVQFVWTVHHLINDGWSYPILLNEVLSFYQASVAGQALVLPLPPPFVNYIEWLQRQDMVQAEGFWREQLSGFTEATPLGVSKPSALGQADYQSQHLSLSAEQTENLRQFAHHNHLTLNTVLQGAWALLLARYSNTDDVVFGGVVSGRPATLTGVESMVGMFTNTLPVRIKLDGDANLLPWLQGLQQQQIEQEQYAHCSLVDIQGWSEVPRGSPLFESIFAYENYPLEARWEDLGLVRAMEAIERVPYPLSLVAMLRDVMELHVHYDASRFAPVFMTRLLQHLQTLLVNMLANPATYLHEVSLLTHAESQDLLKALSATTCEYPDNVCVHQLFEMQVASTPEAIALEDQGVSLTYRGLNAKANQLAVWLREQGVQPDMPIAMCLPRSPALIISVLGILKAGGAFLPLDPSYPAERLAYMLENAHASILLTTLELQTQMSLTIVPCVFTAWDSLLMLPVDNLSSQVKPHNSAYCLYTSGSTGKPKGVIMPHKATVNLITWHQRDERLGLPARTLQFSPISFDVSIQDILCTLCCGGTLVLIKEALRRDAAGLLSFLDNQRIERIFLPFVALQQLANISLGWMPPSLRDVITAGEQLHLTDALMTWFSKTDCVLHNHYGPTETHLITTYTLQGQVEDWPLLPPIGKSLANSYLYVLDKHKQLVPRGVPGELYVAGDCLAQGYINRSDLTDERFLPNPFGEGRLYRTSDLVYWQEDGNLMFWGRADNQLKIRGFRIEPGEIEAVLNQHPTVQDGAVVVHECKPGDKRLVAYVVPKMDASDLVAQVHGFLQEKLPDYMVPAAVMVLDTFPLTPSGKLDRKALPAPTWGSAALAAQALPSTPTEQQIADSWQEVLGLQAVGIYDSFFALGGHSLLATQVISRLSQAFGLDIPFHYLFEYPTVAGLAVHIDTLLRTQTLMLNDADGLDEEEMELL